MSRMSRAVAAMLLVCLLVLCTLTGCTPPTQDGTLRVLCTTFAAYDWFCAVVGEREGVRVELLVADGSDLHSYQPTVADKVEVIESDLLVYIGGESDAWVLDMLESEIGAYAAAERSICLSELEGITLRQVHTEHGEDHEHEDEHEHVHHEDESHAHGAFDEHIWLSLQNAKIATAHFAERLSALDPEGEVQYRAAAQDYIDALTQLSQAYAEAVSQARVKELLVADRFPFVYLVEEYGLSYCAAFEGCTTESEASFETVVRLARQADAWQSRCVVVTEGADLRLARSVIASSKSQDQRILTMNSLQAISSARIREGVSYLGLMYENLDVLRQALS